MCSKRGFYRHIRWNLHLTFCLSRLCYLWKRKKTQPTSDLFGTGTLSSDFFLTIYVPWTFVVKFKFKMKENALQSFFFLLLLFHSCLCICLIFTLRFRLILDEFVSQFNTYCSKMSIQRLSFWKFDELCLTLSPNFFLSNTSECSEHYEISLGHQFFFAILIGLIWDVLLSVTFRQQFEGQANHANKIFFNTIKRFLLIKE